MRVWEKSEESVAYDRVSVQEGVNAKNQSLLRSMNILARENFIVFNQNAFKFNSLYHNKL